MNMEKTFWGYNNREEAEEGWPKEVLDRGKLTTKISNVVDDSTKWPQTSSSTKTITYIELKHDIIGY